MKSNLAMTMVSVLAFATGAQAAQKSASERDVQSYPTKPIRVIVPQAPGGSNDIMARYIGGQLGERLGKQVVVDNRAGAEGMIGTETVATREPRRLHATHGLDRVHDEPGGGEEAPVRSDQGLRLGRDVRQGARRDHRRAGARRSTRCRT